MTRKVTERTLVCWFCVLFGVPLQAAVLHETRTVFLLEQGLAGFDIYQKMYLSNGDLIFVREQSLLLAMSKRVELGIHIPYINSVQRQGTFSRIGDMKISLNIATDWFRRYILTNFFLEHNTGTGPSYFEASTNKMEAYGFPEWRMGLIFLRKFELWAAHLNIFYVMRGARDDGEREKTLFNGMTFDVLKQESWNRWLGFNPSDERNFFYRGNFSNDIFEYNIAASTDLLYPFVLFSEMTFSHDFRSYRGFRPQAPGSGIPRWQMIVGGKFFMADDHFALKAAVVLPVGSLTDIYSLGIALGARMEF